MASEFAIIERYFKRPTTHTVLGVGDDGALIRAAAGMDLVVSTDMLVSGTHFLAAADAADLGWKALAVNVSDMAAMGAAPRWALLAMALPAATESWLEKFAGGFFACAQAFGIDVVGGDTTRGPRNICVTILGEVPQGQALRRSGARVGDDIWVSGSPGLAALGLAHLQGRCLLEAAAAGKCLQALHRPQPRVGLGQALRGVAHAAIDVSDGLLADLGHVLRDSGCSATLRLADLPGDALAATGNGEIALDCLLAGGDDYELVFTAARERHDVIRTMSASLALPLSRIGRVIAGPAGAVEVLDEHGQPIPVGRAGYDHFA